jgi:hypothetical protein
VSTPLAPPPAALREQLELAVIADLKKLGLVVRAYEGEIGDGSAERLDAIRMSLKGITPGVLVTTADATFTTDNLQRRRYTRALELQLVVVAKSLRSRHEQRLGDKGIYRLLELVEGQLSGWDAGLQGVGAMRVTAERPWVQEPDLCVWLVTFAVPTDFAAPDRAELGADDLVGIDGSLNLPETEAVIAEGTGDTLTAAAGVATVVDAGMLAAAGWVGLVVRVSGCGNALNNGDFTITAVPAATQLQYSNPLATPESEAFTWKLLSPVATLSVEVSS